MLNPGGMLFSCILDKFKSSVTPLSIFIFTLCFPDNPTPDTPNMPIELINVRIINSEQLLAVYNANFARAITLTVNYFSLRAVLAGKTIVVN